MDNRAQIAASQLGASQTPLQSSGAVPTLDELLTCHPEYDPDLIEEYQTWYDGGHRFQEALECDRVGRYLVLRRADKERLDANYTYRKLRISRAQYSSEIGRIIASMQATILRNPPTLVDDDSYVRGLNADADGAGTDLKDLARQILECGLLHKRAYLGPTFPGSIAAGSMDMDQATRAGALDGKLRFYHARNVQWWNYAADGRLSSVRVYTCADQYSRGTWGTVTARVHKWAVIDDTQIVTYSYVQEAVNGRLVPLDKSKLVTFDGAVLHGFKQCPIREYQFGKAFWVADRLVPPQKRLFNSEADEAFIRSECAHPQRVINGSPAATVDENGNHIVKATPVHALQFAEGQGDFKMVGPDAAQATWHGAAIERDRQNLYAALESLYLGLASQSQNARQAASAKAMDASHSTLFMAFAASLLESLILSTVGAIKEKRNSNSPLTMEGLNKIDGRSLEQAMTEAQQFTALGPPEAAKEWIIRAISTRMCAGAPDEVMTKIQTEPLDEPKVPVAPKPGMPKPDEGDTPMGNENEDEDDE
jgi:hypothetical protein